MDATGEHHADALIARWSSGQGVKAIDQVFRALARRPKMGRACDELREGYRKFPHASQVIYCKEQDEDTVLFVRILHMTMDLDTNTGA
ncbi:MAG: type II toxin-antitoxin system RelE/ParE family toxin [Lysobacterales bacterium]